MASLNLSSIIAKGRALFVSPYTNFNLVLGLHIAQQLAMDGVRVHLFTDFNVGSRLFYSFELGNHELLKPVKNLDDDSLAGSTLVAIVTVADDRILDLALDRFSNFFVFAHKILAFKHRRCCNKYRVRKLDASLYSISSNDYVLLVKVVNGRINEVGPPKEVLQVAEELRSVTEVFGCVKASNFVKYLVRKLGYGRNKCLELLRLTIALGVVRYRNGYLCPG